VGVHVHQPESGAGVLRHGAILGVTLVG
jgi:hypothetical protein